VRSHGDVCWSDRTGLILLGGRLDIRTEHLSKTWNRYRVSCEFWKLFLLNRSILNQATGCQFFLPTESFLLNHRTESPNRFNLTGSFWLNFDWFILTGSLFDWFIFWLIHWITSTESSQPIYGIMHPLNHHQSKSKSKTKIISFSFFYHAFLYLLYLSIKPNTSTSLAAILLLNSAILLATSS
jgi:hypothetical protein